MSRQPSAACDRHFRSMSSEAVGASGSGTRSGSRGGERHHEDSSAHSGRSPSWHSRRPQPRPRRRAGSRSAVVDNSDKSAVIGAAVTLSNANKLVATTTLLTDARRRRAVPGASRAARATIVTVIMDGYAGIRQEASVSIGSHEGRRPRPRSGARPSVSSSPAKRRRSTSIKNETSTSSRPISSPTFPWPDASTRTCSPSPRSPGPGQGREPQRQRRARARLQDAGRRHQQRRPVDGDLPQPGHERLDRRSDGDHRRRGRRVRQGPGRIRADHPETGVERLRRRLRNALRSKLLDGNGATNVPSYLVPDFHIYQPSLQVSGPIVKDQLWYRFSGELIRREDPLVLAAGGDLKTVGTRRNSYDAQVTWQVSNRNKLAFNFRTDPLKRTNVGISAVAPAESTETNTFGGPTYTLTWTAPYSPSLLVDTDGRLPGHAHRSSIPRETGVPNNCAFTTFPGCESSSASTSRAGVTSGSSVPRLGGLAPAVHREERRHLLQGPHVEARTTSSRSEWSSRTSAISATSSAGRRSSSSRPRSRHSGPLRAARPEYKFSTSWPPWSRPAPSGPWGRRGGLRRGRACGPSRIFPSRVGLRIEQEDINAPGFTPVRSAGRVDASSSPGGAPNAESPDGRALAGRPASRPSRTSTAALDVAAEQFNDDQRPSRSSRALTIRQQTTWTRFRQPDDINIHNTNIAPRLLDRVGSVERRQDQVLVLGRAGSSTRSSSGSSPPRSEPVLANFDAQSIAMPRPLRAVVRLLAPSIGT